MAMNPGENETTIISYWQRYPFAFFFAASGVVFAISSFGFAFQNGTGELWKVGPGFLIFVVSELGLLQYERVHKSSLATKIERAVIAIGVIGSVAAYGGWQVYLAFAGAAAAAILMLWKRFVAGADAAASGSGQSWTENHRTLLQSTAVAALLLAKSAMAQNLRGLGWFFLVATVLVFAGLLFSRRTEGVIKPWQVTIKLISVAMALMLVGLTVMFGLTLAKLHGIHVDPIAINALGVTFLAIPAVLSIAYSIRLFATNWDSRA